MLSPVLQSRGKLLAQTWTGRCHGFPVAPRVPSADTVTPRTHLAQGAAGAGAAPWSGLALRAGSSYAARCSATASLYGRRRSPSSTSSAPDASFGPYPSLVASRRRAA